VDQGVALRVILPPVDLLVIADQDVVEADGVGVVSGLRRLEGSAGADDVHGHVADRVRPDAPCTQYKCNAKLQIVEFAVFDDEENAAIELAFTTNTTFSVPVNGGFFPQLDNGAVTGWIYMNLANESVTRQAWVITSMRAEGRYSLDMDAASLGNGCSQEVGLSEVDVRGTAIIGPAPNITPP
jgi:hypothetical protein